MPGKATVSGSSEYLKIANFPLKLSQARIGVLSSFCQKQRTASSIFCSKRSKLLPTVLKHRPFERAGPEGEQQHTTYF